MAALSMTCGVCQIQLRSVEEAQEHAKLTGHTDFSESTEPVLNLVCKSCGKPCRTKTECDLHTKRTGHGDFDDKTADAAKPISLRTKPEEGAGSSAPEASSDSKGDYRSSDSTLEKPSLANGLNLDLATDLMIPEVDKKILEEMDGMGFPHVRAIRALHFSGICAFP